MNSDPIAATSVATVRLTINPISPKRLSIPRHRRRSGTIAEPTLSPRRKIRSTRAPRRWLDDVIRQVSWLTAQRPLSAFPRARLAVASWTRCSPLTVAGAAAALGSSPAPHSLFLTSAEARHRIRTPGYSRFAGGASRAIRARSKASRSTASPTQGPGQSQSLEGIEYSTDRSSRERNAGCRKIL